MSNIKKQHVRTRNFRAALAFVKIIENEKYSIKRHGKLEYQADLKRSSNIKYKYKGGSSVHTFTNYRRNFAQFKR